jgi:hypothetical protein
MSLALADTSERQASKLFGPPINAGGTSACMPLADAIALSAMGDLQGKFSLEFFYCSTATRTGLVPECCLAIANYN